MDWDLAIKRNAEALKGIIVALFALLGMSGTEIVAQIPRSLHKSVLRVLRPAESAMRRLIVIAARGLVVKRAASRPNPSQPKPSRPLGQGGASRRPFSFRLFDTRRTFPFRHRRRKFTGPLPRIHIYPYHTLQPLPPPVAVPAPPPDGLVNAQPLSRRLQALKGVLEDLPRQAMRLARWRARRAAAKNPKFLSPLRPGRPPGRRRKPTHLVDEVLIELHGLAFDALKPDTS